MIYTYHVFNIKSSYALRAILLLLAGAFSAIQSVAIDTAALMNHIHVMQEIKQRFKQKLPKELAQNNEPTATQSYLNVPQLHALTEHEFSSEKVAFKQIINQAIEREKEFNGTHYVFYHAQNNSFSIVQDLLKRIHSYLSLTAQREDFTFLRSWHDALSIVQVNQFIDEYERGNPNSVWFDGDHDLVKKLLSVNLSFFGNAWRWGESTFTCFLKNKSFFAPAVHPLLQSIFDEFHFDKKYIPELLKLADLIYSQQGNLFQIFIPKQIVNDVVYLAHKQGTPYRDQIVAQVYDAKKRRHLKIREILDMYKNNPAAINALGGQTIIPGSSTLLMDALQARIIFSNEHTLNPESGIKIFRYTTVDDQKLMQYEQAYDQIIQKLMNVWIESGSYKKLNTRTMQLNTDRLMRLMRYIQQGI